MKTQTIKTRSETQTQYAGIFSSWLRRTRNMLLNSNGVSVPCGTCRGCCTSSKFIHIKPHETETLSRISKKLLFPAPFLSKGNVLMGYNENGHCPMLINGNCSIYEHRPLTCRQYDCRIFCAAGLPADDDDKLLINTQLKNWEFSYPHESDHQCSSAVLEAAKFIKENPDCFPNSKVPDNTSQLAILAIKVYDVFLASNIKRREKSNSETAKEIIAAHERFEAKYKKMNKL